jgi:hypothetical protein
MKESIERLCAIMLRYGDGAAPRLVGQLRAALGQGSPVLAERSRNAWDNCMRQAELPAAVRDEAGALLLALSETRERIS